MTEAIVMTADDIIDAILDRENGYVDHPNDHGGPTNAGITAKTLGLWRALGRHATRAEVKALKQPEARLIYRHIYIERPGFTVENIPHERLRIALIDEGVNAGPTVAVKHLQEALGVTADGIFGPITRTALRAWASGNGLLLQVVYLRCMRQARIVRDDPTQSVFVVGWTARAFSMILP